jgi:hypothetical protein
MDSLRQTAHQMASTGPRSSKVAMNINFDSLGWSLNAERARFRDPSFVEVADRFLDLSARYGFRYTIFVIGRDLESPEARARVRDWSAAGHEIGNHSYNHCPNLGAMPIDQMRDEVMRSHDAIAAVVGSEPKGFIAPGWSASAELVGVLQDAGYVYDTSVFPSYFMWLIVAKLWLNFRGDPRRRDFLQRRDWLANLLASTRPYLASRESLHRAQREGLLILPVPVSPTLRIPCWHTARFVFPQWLYEHALQACRQAPYFYYLMHPADLSDPSDLQELGLQLSNLERWEVSQQTKLRFITEVLDSLREGKVQFVTLREMADEIIAKGNYVSA